MMTVDQQVAVEDVAATMRTVTETLHTFVASELARLNAEAEAARLERVEGRRPWRWVLGRGFTVPQRGSGSSEH